MKTIDSTLSDSVVTPLNPMSLPDAGPNNPYTLGLDMGASSIGIGLMFEKPISTGMRLLCFSHTFPQGVTPKSGVSLMSKHGDIRRMRRAKERRQRRITNVRNILIRNGMLPDKIQNAEAYQTLLDMDPYLLREKGLYEPLSLQEFGRAIYNLAQRRGYKSNSKKQEVSTDDRLVLGSIKSVENRMESLGTPTYGSYIANLPKGQYFRNRSNIPSGSDYHAFKSRASIEDEFNMLWDSQIGFNPELGDLHDAPAKMSLRDSLFHMIFHQRPLKSCDHLIGQCSVYPTMKRAPKESWIAQRFRVVEFAVNVRIEDGEKNERSLTQDERNTLIDYLHHNDSINIGSIKKMFGLKKHESVNFERSFGKSKIHGNRVSHGLRLIFGERFDREGMFLCNRVWECFIGKGDNAFHRANKRWGITEEQQKDMLDLYNKIKKHEKSKTSLSRQAMKEALPCMENYGWNLTQFKQHKGLLSEQHTPCEHIKTFPKTLPNPVVRTASAEMRKLVNNLIKVYGKPSRIVIELAREAKLSKEERSKIQLHQKARQERRDHAAKEIKDAGFNPTHRAIEKYLIWEDCNKTCIYSGMPIPLEQMFGPNPTVDIDHIHPYSKSLMDGQINKVVAYKDWNIAKGDSLPYQIWGGTDQWENIVKRAEALVKSKKWSEFKLKHFLAQNIDPNAAIERHLNDTRYIVQEVRRKLERLGIPIITSNGESTATLRKIMTGLKKDRSDHRHHAVDAAILSVVDHKTIARLRDRNYVKLQYRDQIDEPYPGFAREVRVNVASMIVTNKPPRNLSGQWHEETNYAKKTIPGVGMDMTVVRKNLVAQNFKNIASINQIADRRIRKEIMNRVISSSKEKEKDKIKEALSRPIYLNGCQYPTRRARVIAQSKSIIPLKANGKAVRHVNSGSNHHSIAIRDQDGKARSLIVTTFEAYKRAASGEEIVQVPDGCELLCMFQMNGLYRLSKSPVPSISTTVWRVQKMDFNSKGNHVNVNMVPHNVAGSKGTSKQGFIVKKAEMWAREFNPKRISIGKSLASSIK